MDITTILGNVASGGLLGLLGTAVNFGLSYFKARQENRQKLEWAKEERETMKLQGDLQAARTAGDVAVARESGAAAAFTASIEAEGKLPRSFAWVDAVRGLTRPFLTVFLLILTWIIYYSADDTTKAYIAQNIVVTAVAAVTWWFGQRQLDRSTTSWGNRTAGASVSSGATKP